MCSMFVCVLHEAHWARSVSTSYNEWRGSLHACIMQVAEGLHACWNELSSIALPRARAGVSERKADMLNLYSCQQP